jgi:hypothetical protein
MSVGKVSKEHTALIYKKQKTLERPWCVAGVGSPRAMSVTGEPLPSPRLISVSVHPDTTRPHVRYSLMFMQYAQLLDHDLTHTPVNKGTTFSKA